jgi:hypothetical protein
MLPASLIGFLLGQLCSCLEVMKAVHISLLSCVGLTGRNQDLTILRLSSLLIGDLGHSTMTATASLALWYLRL